MHGEGWCCLAPLRACPFRFRCRRSEPAYSMCPTAPLDPFPCTSPSRRKHPRQAPRGGGGWCESACWVLQYRGCCVRCQLQNGSVPEAQLEWHFMLASPVNGPNSSGPCWVGSLTGGGEPLSTPACLVTTPPRLPGSPPYLGLCDECWGALVWARCSCCCTLQADW